MIRGIPLNRLCIQFNGFLIIFFCKCSISKSVTIESEKKLVVEATNVRVRCSLLYHHDKARQHDESDDSRNEERMLARERMQHKSS